MSKQVEVPEGVEPIFIDRETRTVYFGPSMREQVVSVDDLGIIYKHFSDRLLSDEVVGAMFEVLHPRSNCGWKGLTREQRDYWRSGLEAAALQAASIPEVDRG